MSNRAGSGRPQELCSGIGVLLAACALAAWGAPTARAADLPIAIDAAKIRTITEDVLASQRDPRGRSQKIEALRAYERFVMKDLEGRSNLKAEAIHRLADLYAELETSTYDKRVREARAGKDRGSTRPALDRAKSIAIYERLLARYPDRPENDSALYQLARAYWQTDRMDEAVARLQTLRTRHPRSAYAAEAAFRLGEHAVAERDFPRAVELFRNARGGIDPTLVESAAFQLGWASLNLQEYRAAADAFVSILDTAARPPTGESGRGAAASSAVPTPQPPFSLARFTESEAAFLAEVIKALLIGFDFLGGPGEMRAYFDTSGRRVYEPTLYRTMATLLEAQDRTADAVDAYEAFLAAYPTHSSAPEFQAAIAETYTRAKWQTALIAAREQLVERYGPDSAWARATTEAGRQTGRPLVKEALYQLALYDHAQAQTAKRGEAYQRAIARDDRFLAWFPKDIEAPRIAWLRADALFELGRYADSAEGYRRAAYDYPLHAHSREAGYAAVVAWERTLSPNGPIAVQAVNVLLDRVDRFLAAFPDDARNPDLLMKAAETAARAQLAERAHDTAQRLVTTYPKSRWTAQATRLIGQTLYDRGEYRAAERAFRQALTTASGVQADALAGLAASALYRDAVAQRAAGQAPVAARAFIKVADDFPTTALAPVALLAAADLASESGDAPGATRLWTRVANDYRPSDQATPALRRLAAAAVKDGDPAGAIGWYEALAARSTPPARDDLTWTIAELAEQSHLWPRAERAFAELAARPDLDPLRSIEAGFRAAEAVTHQGHREEASQRAETTLDRYRAWRAQRATGADLTAVDALAGAALLDLADRRAAACVAVSLVNPLEQTLARKQAALDLALATYAEAADLRLARVATAAAHKIGGLLDEFFHALLKSERPGELTPAQIEQYTILLEERAAPIEERAVAAYETNVRRAQELGLYDEWIGKSFERLAVLRPARYQRPERAELVRRTLEALR